MANRSGWLPGSRTGQLNMAKQWKEVMAAKQNEWNIPAGTMSGFDGLVQAADSALTAALNETTRTAAANALCKAAFEALDKGCAMSNGAAFCTRRWPMRTWSV